MTNEKKYVIVYTYTQLTLEEYRATKYRLNRLEEVLGKDNKRPAKPRYNKVYMLKLAGYFSQGLGNLAVIFIPNHQVREKKLEINA